MSQPRVFESTAYNRDYYEEHRAAGLDYLSYGDWQRNYGRWLVEAMLWRDKAILDVGCACGSILRGLGEAGVVIRGIDLNEHMIQLGRSTWPDMARLLDVCDAANLHLFGDDTFDGLHSNQVAEHWRPELVPFILRELRRVTKTGGYFWCCLDTVEMFERQGRDVLREDPTHICVKPMQWWYEQLVGSGWKVCTDQWQERLRTVPGSYLLSYDWDIFVAQAG